MKIKTITIGKSVEALGQWNKGGLEAELQEGDDVDKCWLELKGKLDELLPSVNGNGGNVEFYSNGLPLPKDYVVVENVKITTKEERVQAIIETITSSKTIKEAEFWKNTVEKEKIPELTLAYNETINKFKMQ